MPPRKRKLEDELDNEPPKYTAGKVPRNDENPPIDYTEPLNPDSELFRDEWSIPKFNMFVTYTLDHLSETYKNIFKDFIKLPSRKFHPQYYYKIEQPISVNEIKTRDYEYPDGPRDFLLDVELLSKNCASYNEEDSLIVKNSLQMVNFIEYETLKAKNVKRNYIITGDIKIKLLGILERIIDATAKTIDDDVPELKASLQDPEDDEFKLSEPFMELVDRDELPEYYEIIYRPMALAIIKKNLEVGYYSKIYDFITEVELIFDNTMIYNNSTALIYQSAKALLEYFNFIIQDVFFKELKDLSERGEINLEYDKYDYEKYLGHVKNEDQPTAQEESEDDFDDFNHIEGLGNGYTRNLLADDYLLGPNYQGITDQPKATQDSNIPQLADKINKQADILKYNIIKSIKNESVSEQYKMEKKEYKLISEISIFSSRNLYTQGINPMQGSRPACSQNWLEFNFIGKELNQNGSTFSFSLEPIQTFLTVIAKLNETELKSTLLLNSDIIKPRKDTKKPLPPPQQHSPDNADTIVEELKERDPEPEKFDLRLNEGLNLLEFKCGPETEDDTEETNLSNESMKFWINVLP